MSTSVTVSEARASLAELVERVLAGEEVTLTRHGVAVVVLVRPEALRARRAERSLAAAASVHELLESGRRTPVGSGPGLTQEQADALLDEVRAGRSRP